MKHYHLIISAAVLLLTACTTPPPPSGPGPLCLHTGHTLSEIEAAVIDEINRVRARPELYAEIIEESGRSSPAALEAVGRLEFADPMPPLTPSDCLSLSARDHVEASGSSGTFGHAGFADRVARYLTVPPRGAAENISYGYDTAREIVLQWLIDEGIGNRGHREALLNENYRSIGVAFGPHTEYDHMCVVIFTTDRL